MAELGIDGDIKEPESVPYDRLAEAYRRVKPEFMAAGKYLSCAPHPNEFYKGSPNENGFREETAQIPMVVGTVYGEFFSFASPKYDKNKLTFEEGIEIVKQAVGEEAVAELLPLYTRAYPQRNPVEMLALDFIFRLPAQQYIRQRSERNQCIYSYLFNQDLPIHGGNAPWHCADIPYVFHNTELVPVTQDEGVTEKLEAQIFDSVIAFAKTGNPNHPGIPHWPVCRPGEEQTMIFSSDTQVSCNHDAELIPLLAKYMDPMFERMLQEIMGDVQH